MVEYPNEDYSKDTEKQNKTFGIANFMPQILPGVEIANNINSLNLKQR